MKIGKLNTTTLKKLQPESTRYTVQVKGKTGLLLIVNPDKTISFTYRFQIEGRRRRMTLGVYPDEISLEDGNILYAKARKAVKNGIDPLAKRENQKLADESDPTITELVERYLKFHVETKLKPRTATEYRRQFQRDILPKWGKRKAKEIQRPHVVALVEKMATKTPIQANRTLATIKGMFSYAERVGILAHSPAARIPAPGKETVKDRYLDMKEIAIFTTVLKNEQLVPPTFQDVMLLILLTGQRPGEVCSMHLEQIKKEKDGFWWEMAGSETKNGRSHRVYLNEPARRIIDNRVETLSLSKYIFPATGKMPHLRIDTLRPRVAGIQPRMQEAGVPWFTAHDLRRSAATGMAILGHGAVVPYILNHALQGITRQVYDKYNRAPEIRRALIAWGNAVDAATTGQKEQKVVEIDFN